MRKVIFILCVFTIALSSCGSYYEVSGDFDVLYNDGTQNKKEVVIAKASRTSMPSVKCYSEGGTNYISVITDNYDEPFSEKRLKPCATLISTTAQLRLNKHTIRKLAKKEARELMGVKEYVDEYNM